MRLENVVAEVGAKGEGVLAAGVDGLVYRGVVLNGVAQKDGPVAAPPGSDAPLRRTRAVSWEARDARKRR